MSLIGTAAGCSLALAGVTLLRRAWKMRGGAAAILGGWALLALGVLAWAATGAGWDKAVAFALLVPGLVALVWIAATAELPGSRIERARRTPDAVEPPASSGAAWRGWVRVLLAGPVGLAAAVAISAALGLHAPGGEPMRVTAAGFILPLAWAAALVWATTDERIVRVAAGLGAALALGVIGAVL